MLVGIQPTEAYVTPSVSSKTEGQLTNPGHLVTWSLKGSFALLVRRDDCTGLCIVSVVRSGRGMEQVAPLRRILIRMLQSARACGQQNLAPTIGVGAGGDRGDRSPQL